MVALINTEPTRFHYVFTAVYSAYNIVDESDYHHHGSDNRQQPLYGLIAFERGEKSRIR